MRAIEAPKSYQLKGADAGVAPILQWVKVADLVVDESYQRELKKTNWTQIRAIAAAFKWSRFSPVFVAPIEGGRFAVIDGQHRTHAAALCGVREVPCQIVHMTREEQAASFAAVNGTVTKVTSWNIFKAALAAGEQWAVECDRACSEAGCTLMTRAGATDAKKPGEIYAISLIRKMVAIGASASVTHALAGLRKSEFGADAATYANEILLPYITAVVNRPWLAKQNVDLARFVDSFDIYGALDRAGEYARRKRREGVTGVSRNDLAAAEIGEGLDRAFPQRVALPPLALPKGEAGDA